MKNIKIKASILIIACKEKHVFVMSGKNYKCKSSLLLSYMSQKLRRSEPACCLFQHFFLFFRVTTKSLTVTQSRAYTLTISLV